MPDLRAIESACLDGVLNPLEAARAIDEGIGGITRVYVRPQRVSIANHERVYHLQLRGRPASERGLLCEVGAMVWLVALQSGSPHPGEVHLDGAASRHHSAGIYELAAKYS